MSIEQNEKSKYKIAVLLIPFWGHLNPVAGMVNELVKKYKANVIFYGNKENKTLIESIGASFRQYSYYPTAEYMAQSAKEKTMT